MLQYKAGYKYVAGGVHAQVLDFPAAITCADTWPEARKLLGMAASRRRRGGDGNGIGDPRS